MSADLPRAPGTYVLVLRAVEPGAEVAIGALGTLRLEGGWYLYVGSAFGPGGLRARVGRHLSAGKTPHWHIDHLLPAVRVRAVWLSTHERKLEARWIQALRDLPASTVPLRGFGAGDCGCEGHLVHVDREPEPGLVGRRPGEPPVRVLRP